MIVKQPFVPDTSTYNEYIDWSKVVCDAAIVKASEGYLFEDNQFKNSWPQLEALGKPRGAYHFYRKLWPAAWQAKKFVTTLNKYGGLLPGDKVILDAEEEGMSISAILDCMYNIELLTGCECMLYSRAELLNNLSFAKLSGAQREWIAERKIWTAGYPVNPDLYSEPPAIFRPDPTRYGPVVLWQYTDKTRYPGIPGVTDTNWIDPAFLHQWVLDTIGEVPTPEPKPEHVESYTFRVRSDKAELIEARANFQTYSQELTNVRFEVEPYTEPPTPPPSNLYDLKIRTVEWLEQPAPPAIGSFAILGGRGVDCWLEVDKAMEKFVRSIKIPALHVDNDLLWPWATGHDFTGIGKTVYYGYDAATGTRKWGIGLMSSFPGYARQFCKLEKPLDPGEKFQHVLGIPYQASGDYSAWTPDKHPEVWFACYSIYPPKEGFPNGYLGPESHNDMLFLMPFFQAGTGYKLSGSAKEYGGWIATSCFYGPHQ